MLERLGRGAARHHWAVIGAWIAVAILLSILAKHADGHTKDVFTIPGTESQQAFDLLQERFPAANAPSAQVVFHSTSGPLTGTAEAAAITATIAEIQKMPAGPDGHQPDDADVRAPTSPTTRPPPTPPSPSRATSPT